MGMRISVVEPIILQSIWAKLCNWPPLYCAVLLRGGNITHWYCLALSSPPSTPFRYCSFAVIYEILGAILHRHIFQHFSTKRRRIRGSPYVYHVKGMPLDHGLWNRCKTRAKRTQNCLDCSYPMLTQKRMSRLVNVTVLLMYTHITNFMTKINNK